MTRKILYVDATQGASGDMLLGALVDLGVGLDVIRSAVDGLAISGWSIEAHEINRCGLAVTKVDVKVDETGPARRWRDIEQILASGSLPGRIHERASATFRRLIEAEATAHGRSPEEVHLHEAGATDAFVDVVGVCAGLEHLGIDEVVVSTMTTGFGEVRCAHGLYPVPAPATALLVRGAPVRGGEIEAERLTPTGAALLTTLADRWGSLPEMRPISVGMGAGSRDLGEVPNALRLILGETESVAIPLGAIEGEVAVIECALDDTTPQALAFAAERLLEAGALDVFTCPLTMKKGRQGHQLTVLGRPADASQLARRVLCETSTLGLRFRFDKRVELEREVARVETPYGPVAVKAGLLEGRVLHAWPEYDDCARLAEHHGVSLTQVQQAALKAYASTRTPP